MKKVLSVLLAALMCVSMLAVTAFAAPEGTAITTAAEFYAMTETGTYYLANDITIDSSCTTLFRGTLDGNGKTITTTVPLFVELVGGTIKDLTIEGSITNFTSTKIHLAAVAPMITSSACGDIVLENITNNANVINSNGQSGGLIGLIYGNSTGASSLTLKNCVNNGTIHSDNNHVGGLVAYKQDSALNSAYTLTAIDCTNNGNITTLSANGCGGIFGAIASGKKDVEKNQVTLIKNCVNNGTITRLKTGTAAYSGVGGIVGSLAGHGTIFNCKNTGAINATTARTGGIMGTTRYNTDETVIENCDNFGTVTATGVHGEILGNVAEVASTGYGVTIKNCYTVNSSAAIYGGTADRVTSSGTPAAEPQYKAPSTPDPDPDPDPDPNPGTGDATVMIVSAAVVAVVASVVVIRRKKEEQF